MQRSKYLANLQLATRNPSWQEPSRAARRPTLPPQPIVRPGFVLALAWSLVLYVGCR